MARLYHGASAAFFPRPVITAIVECCRAAAFSSIIRWYSEGVQVPWAIIEVLRATVSHDAVSNSAIISGSVRVWRRASLFIARDTWSAAGVMSSLWNVLLLFPGCNPPNPANFAPQEANSALQGDRDERKVLSPARLTARVDHGPGLLPSALVAHVTGRRSSGRRVCVQPDCMGESRAAKSLPM